MQNYLPLQRSQRLNCMKIIFPCSVGQRGWNRIQNYLPCSTVNAWNQSNKITPCSVVNVRAELRRNPCALAAWSTYGTVCKLICPCSMVNGLNCIQNYCPAAWSTYGIAYKPHVLCSVDNVWNCMETICLCSFQRMELYENYLPFACGRRLEQHTKPSALAAWSTYGTVVYKTTVLPRGSERMELWRQTYVPACGQRMNCVQNHLPLFAAFSTYGTVLQPFTRSAVNV
ncbi:hypothetical protein AVEN_174516-1 [Araneus ventricosus]|uniref:Uncharacterized protein n=1 Tax=Araneus ventricosus TaxID=182803 RepID=A0A4Y2SZZ0_ARAVE|nr:hypothetical protein AVEN_174516-1 [Araneus ventricosus]